MQFLITSFVSLAAIWWFAYAAWLLWKHYDCSIRIERWWIDFGVREPAPIVPGSVEYQITTGIHETVLRGEFGMSHLRPSLSDRAELVRRQSEHRRTNVGSTVGFEHVNLVTSRVYPSNYRMDENGLMFPPAMQGSVGELRHAEVSAPKPEEWGMDMVPHRKIRSLPDGLS